MPAPAIVACRFAAPIPRAHGVLLSYLYKPRGMSVVEPEWSDFRIILALARGGSVAGAARLLNIDSSTVSRRLGAIEEVLGATLVIRGGRDFHLTYEGSEALAAAEAMETAVTHAASSIRAARTSLEGVVRISCVSTIVNRLLPFQELVGTKYPGLAVQFIPTNRKVDLNKGEAEIAIRNTRPTEGDLIARRGFDLGMAAYASKAYLARHGTPQYYADLKAHALIQYSQTMLHLPWFSWIEQFADPARPATRVEIDGNCQWAGHGRGRHRCLDLRLRRQLARYRPGISGADHLCPVVVRLPRIPYGTRRACGPSWIFLVEFAETHKNEFRGCPD